MGFVWLLIQLPYSWQQTLGKYLGLFAQYFAKRAASIAKTNLTLCFPTLSAEKRKLLLRQNFIALGQSSLAMAFGWWGAERRLRKLIKLKNLHFLEEILAKPQAALIFTPHFMGIHFVGRLINLVSPIKSAAMYLPPKNPVLAWLSWRAMQKHYALAIERDDVRSLIRALKNKIPVFYTPDTDPGRKNSLFIPFFGVPAATSTATPRFAQLTGCAVLPLDFSPLPQAKGYEVCFEPALADFPSTTEKDLQIINRWLEARIRQQPQNYLWQYKRFKTRPVGEAKLY